MPVKTTDGGSNRRVAHQDACLTTTEAIEYLRTSPRTLYRHLATGDLPGVRVGHQWRFRKSDLDQWLTLRSSTQGKRFI
jgi:excisionase family DNA binding protein